jgi:hypothetical protein
MLGWAGGFIGGRVFEEAARTLAEDNPFLANRISTAGKIMDFASMGFGAGGLAGGIVGIGAGAGFGILEYFQKQAALNEAEVADWNARVA